MHDEEFSTIPIIGNIHLYQGALEAMQQRRQAKSTISLYLTFIRDNITTQARGIYLQNLLQPLLGGLPVNNIPDGREVLGLAVLVLQVVGVLPGVNAKDRAELADDGVLVGVGLDADVAGLHVLHQPCPAGALDTGKRGVELALQLVERTVGLVNLGGKGARWGLTAALGLGSEVLPEEGVVCVSACCGL